MKHLLLLFTIWTYGSEALDNMIANTEGLTEWHTFQSQVLKCDVQQGQVVCEM